MTEVWPGRPFPLGAMWDGSGTNFSIFSENAEGVGLCLFDEGGESSAGRAAEHRAHVWYSYVPGVGPGSATATGCAGPTRPPRAIASTPTSC